MSYSLKGFSGGLSTLIVAGISYAGITTFVKGTFSRAFTDYNLIDLLLAVSMLLFAVALILIIKDMFDGGGWTQKEKQKAIKGLGVALVLIIGSYVGASFAGGDALQLPAKDEFQSTSYYLGGTSGHEIAVTVSEQYLALAASGQTDNTEISIALNQTGFTEAFIRSLGGFNMTIDALGVDRVRLQYYDSVDGATDLLDSTDDEISLTAGTSTTDVNVTFTLAVVLGWITAHVYDSQDDYYRILVAITPATYDTDTAHVFTFNWIVSSDSDAIYYLVLFTMSIGFIYPFISMLDLTNAKRAPRRTYPRKKKRKVNYNRRY